MEKLKKISTHIAGLDDLFYNGISLDDEKDNNPGLIIALRGKAGTLKMQFAIQLMCGLTKSILEREEKSLQQESLLFSINKDERNLQRICDDFQIANLLHIIEEDESTDDGKLNNALLNFFKVADNINLVEMIRNRAIYYNARTHSLHIRRRDPKDSEENRLGEPIILKNELIEDNIPIKNELINVNIPNIKESNAHSPITEFLKIQNHIADIKNLIPCIVIHGFSQFSAEELNRLQLFHLESQLREKARVSILVFDEKGFGNDINPDIVIDMRQNEYPESKHSYFELKISESAYQVAALGWHQYKMYDYGIEVFPSVHKVVHRRSYMSTIVSDVQDDILHPSFYEYLHRPEYGNKSQDNGKKELKKCLNDYEKFRSQGTFKEIAGKHEGEKCEFVFFDRPVKDERPQNDECIYYRRRKITALVGNPNSFKRMFSYARMFDSCYRDEDTLIILFDRNEFDMRQRIVSLSKKIGCNNKDCHKHIHFWGVRMGCISPSELLFFINKLLYDEYDYKNKKIRNIIVDDLQKIDYSFPLLKNEPLFLSALVTLCKDKNVGLQILCDKRASLATQLCALSDEILCFQREKEDENKVTVYVPQSPEFSGICEIYEYCFQDMDSLFICRQQEQQEQQRKITINPDSVITNRKIGSMKDYWRKSITIRQPNEKD